MTRGTTERERERERQTEVWSRTMANEAKDDV